MQRLTMVVPALHKKSGQKSDPQVNKGFLVSFWLSFETRKLQFGHKKHRHGTLFVQSRLRPGRPQCPGHAAAHQSGSAATAAGHERVTRPATAAARGPGGARGSTTLVCVWVPRAHRSSPFSSTSNAG